MTTIAHTRSSPGQRACGLSLSCSFTDTSSVCTLRLPQLEYDTTYTVPSGCPVPTMTPWALKRWSGGGAVDAAPELNTFVLGHQARGGVTAGPPVGSSPSFVICGDFNSCGAPFKITVSDCYAQDLLYDAYNQTLHVTQGEALFETLEMAGP